MEAASEKRPQKMTTGLRATMKAEDTAVIYSTCQATIFANSEFQTQQN